MRFKRIAIPYRLTSPASGQALQLCLFPASLGRMQRVSGTALFHAGMAPSSRAAHGISLRFLPVAGIQVFQKV